ncbi:MAG: sterol desaturase family protein [Sphingomonas sp.]
MKPEYLAVPAIYIAFAAAEALHGGFFRKTGQTRTDAIVEAVSTFALIGLTQPMVMLAAGLLMHTLVPGAQGVLARWPVLAQLGLLLIFDDMIQYWWHRASHGVPLLYNLHRAHHEAGYMSVRVVYRNNLFYYALMPNLWLSGALIYMGLGWLYAGYAVFKMLVIIGAHSSVRWDAPLYRIRWLSPVMWVVERTLSTPATHYAHHGRHKADGVTNYKGNFGNLLFLWDVLFGTAKITRRYPDAIGVEGMAPIGAATQLLWPLVAAPAALLNN